MQEVVAQFHKYEGLGNDFIVIEEQGPARMSPEQARSLCDRHFGVGADGVLIVTVAAQPGSRATMTVLNADGSRPEMCGNGLRCVALHLALQDGARQVEYAVDTDAGTRRCQVRRDGFFADVSIEMGAALSLGTLTTKHEGRAFEFHRVSVGNPHAVTFDADLSDDAIDQLAPRISAEIAGGSNVEFARRTGEAAFELVVWERGVGRTLACGTGAVATAAAAVLTGRAALQQALELALPGGRLSVTVHEPGLQTTLRGPARRVFGGQLVA